MRTVSTKLNKPDHDLFIETCYNEDKTISDVLRDLILEHTNFNKPYEEKITSNNPPTLENKDSPKQLIVETMLDSEIKNPDKIIHFVYDGDGKYVDKKSGMTYET